MPEADWPVAARMFTFSFATAAATFAVSPMLSWKVAVISFAFFAVNPSFVLLFAGAAARFAVDFVFAFFNALAMVLFSLTWISAAGGRENFQGRELFAFT